MSTLSTDVNTYQQLSTKALYSSNSNEQPTTKGLGNENHVNTINRHQKTATTMQKSQLLSQKVDPPLSSMSTMSTDVNSYQQLSTKGLHGNFSNKHKACTSGLGLENHVNTVNRYQHTATTMQQSQQISLRKYPYYHQASQHCQQMSTTINSCQQRLYVATIAICSLPQRV